MNDSTIQEETPEMNRGGAAPPHRQCRRILESGERCRDWEVRGQGFCFRHGRWDGTRRKGPITVPLLEDAGSIQLVVSQTVRAMSLGTLPPANGRVILMGCREARNLLRDQLAERRLAVQMKRWDVTLEEPEPQPLEVVDASGEWLAPVCDEKERIRQWEAEMRAERLAREQARAAAAAAGTASPEQSAAAPELRAAATDFGSAVPQEAEMVTAAEAEGETDRERGRDAGVSEPSPQERRDADDPPEPDPLWVPDSSAQFRDLKKNWDDALDRVEGQILDRYLKRHDETFEEFHASRARPYEAYFEKLPGEV